VLNRTQGVSLRGTSDDKLISGMWLRKLLVKRNSMWTSMNRCTCRPVSQIRWSRCASALKTGGQSAIDEARLRHVRSGGRKLRHWDNDHVGPSLYSMPGWGKVVVFILLTPRRRGLLETGTYDAAGGQNDDGSKSRGYN